MKITIIGGGNIGTLMAAEFAQQGHAVTVYTSKPERWSKSVTVLDRDNNVLGTGVLAEVTSSMATALAGAELIFVVTPSYTFPDFAEKMLPYVTEGQTICTIPGSGGAEFAFYELRQKGCCITGLQRVHSIARLKEYGHSVYMLGKKEHLYLGTIPQDDPLGMREVIENLFGIDTVLLPNYLAVTLTPSNPILHTTRLYSMFSNAAPDQVYSRNILFYEEWTDDASRMLLACDAELEKLCEAIPMDLRSVVPLRIYYENETPEGLTKKIAGIRAFKGITSPMVQSGQGWVPDWTSRYFTADFDFGLKVIRDIGGLFDIDMPNIERVWTWYKGINADTDYFEMKLDRDAFLALYQ